MLDEGAGISWASSLVAFGALVAITSVMVTIFYGQTRIFFAMARDGLIPRRVAKINPRTGTPVRLTFIMGIFIALLAALVPLSEIVKLVNIGTLFAFLLVNIGVIILRRTQPDMERPFRVPFVPVFPIIGCCLIIYLMTKLPWDTWVRFVVWLAIGLAIYYFYGRHHSRLQIANRAGGGGGGEVDLGSGHEHRHRPRRLGLGRRRRHARRPARPRDRRDADRRRRLPRGEPDRRRARRRRVGGVHARAGRGGAATHARRFLEGRGVQAEYRVVGSSSAAHGLDDVAEAEQRVDDRRRLLAARRAAADLPRLDRRAAAARRDLPRGGRAARACASGRRTRRCGGSASPTSTARRRARRCAWRPSWPRRPNATLTLYTVVAPRAEVVAPVIGRDAEISFLKSVREGARAALDEALAVAARGRERDRRSCSRATSIDELASLDEREVDLLVMRLARLRAGATGAAGRRGAQADPARRVSVGGGAAR